MNNYSVLKGSIISLIITFLSMITITWIIGIGNDLQWLSTYIITIFGGLFLIFFTIIWGLPFHYLMKKYNKNYLFWYILGGFLPFPFFIFLFEPFGDDGFYYMTLQSIQFGAFGVLCSSIFWFLVVRRAT